MRESPATPQLFSIPRVRPGNLKSAEVQTDPELVLQTFPSAVLQEGTGVRNSQGIFRPLEVDDHKRFDEDLVFRAISGAKSSYRPSLREIMKGPSPHRDEEENWLVDAVGSPAHAKRAKRKDSVHFFDVSGGASSNNCSIPMDSVSEKSVSSATPKFRVLSSSFIVDGMERRLHAFQFRIKAIPQKLSVGFSEKFLVHFDDKLKEGDVVSIVGFEGSVGSSTIVVRINGRRRSEKFFSGVPAWVPSIDSDPGLQIEEV